MRLGLLRVRRVGAVHAATPSHLDAVDSLVGAHAVPALTAIRRRGTAVTPAPTTRPAAAATRSRPRVAGAPIGCTTAASGSATPR